MSLLYRHDTVYVDTTGLSKGRRVYEESTLSDILGLRIYVFVVLIIIIFYHHSLSMDEFGHVLMFFALVSCFGESAHWRFPLVQSDLTEMR